jgi:enoyl-[acyl-carrier protein] reductase/trans-2-enoyl-CoA reductase (NAD+)
MIIKPLIRSNIFLNSHPLGCKKYIENLFKEAKALPAIKGVKNVLIIGGSSGYGLSSRIALAVSGKVNTINVSFESRPTEEKTGSAGWWNNLFFQQYAKSLSTKHFDLVADAFSQQTKDQIKGLIKKEFGTVDLVIYSLASGARLNPKTNELVRSSLKSIGDPVMGKTIDIAELKIKELSIPAASEQEIKDTVYVMGGSDWYDWIEQLVDEKLLSEQAKSISYTYIGSKGNAKIYRDGTIGKAKDDLEAYGVKIDALLKEKVKGEGLISVSKAVVTKASVFIPGIPFYVSSMFEVMKKNHVHETILEHKHRLFHQMVYGKERLLDDQYRLRIDYYELQDSIQKDIERLSSQYEGDKIFALQGTKDFIDEFYRINGFRIDGVNYDEDVDLASLSQLTPLGL